MQRLERVVLAMLASCLSGCGSHGVTSVSVAYPDLTGNWQIESAAVQVSGTPSGVLLLGALESSGPTVTGTFRFSNLGQPQSCGLEQVVTVSGTMDANRNVSLTSDSLPNGAVVRIQFVAGTVLTTQAAGTIEVSGTTCGVPSAAAIEVKIAPATGTFSGALTPGTLVAPTAGTPGTGSLVLTQSATPGADGQFPVMGTLSYDFGNCAGSVALSGKVSGVGLAMNSAINPGGGPVPAVILFATVVPTGTSIQVPSVQFNPAPCGGGSVADIEYTGTLSRQ